MNNQERRYKIKQKNNYENQYNELQKFKVTLSRAIGLSAISGAIGVFNYISMSMPNFFTIPLEFVSAGIFITAVAELTETIGKMSLLEIDIRKLTIELGEAIEAKKKNNNKQESVGRKR